VAKTNDDEREAVRIRDERSKEDKGRER